MNLMHLKYAVEIARTKSISKAAEVLYMGQPNLSRAIKELEESLGIVIFNRNSKGITITPEGEEFLSYAKKVVDQINEIEDIYRREGRRKQKLSVCVPRASYISFALSRFAEYIDINDPAEIYYKETNSMTAINSLLNSNCGLAIIRYQSTFDKYFNNLFSEKNLEAETITEFTYVLLVSKKSKLAVKEDIELSDLSYYIEITHSDPYVPSLPLNDVMKAELSEYVNKRIFIFERASQFVLLENVPQTFMWVSPIPQPLLYKHNLVQKSCGANNKKYRDVLVRKKGCKLTQLERQFIDEVHRARSMYL
ncbi:MAG: LysR family transcriptional regulator [Ruminococcus sp.]|nr:LysR family transcriptional regulator [Ruminococcus sp.]